MNNADKAHFFGILTCILIAYCCSFPIFYNFAIGLGIGSSIFYFYLCWRGK